MSGNRSGEPPTHRKDKSGEEMSTGRGIEDYDAQPSNKNRSGEEMQISEGCGLKSK